MMQPLMDKMRLTNYNKNPLKMYKLLFVVSISILSLYSCKKDAAGSDMTQHNEDNSNIKSEFDNNNNDANELMNNVSGFKKTAGVSSSDLCGATIDSSHAKDAIPTLYINYDGTSICPNPARKKSGQIKIELINGKKWHQQDAQMRITYNAYKVIFTNLSNRSIQLSGTKILTNKQAFEFWDIITKGTLSFTYTERATNMNVSFSDGSSAIWNSAREVKWLYTAKTNQIDITVDGDSVKGAQKTESWGVNRFGSPFTTTISQPWQSNTSCGLWAPIKGKATMVTPNFEFDITLGTDKDGKQISTGCASHFNLDWKVISTGKSGSSILPYW
jgi:hypothetical protein